jgi:hypothetical protein
MLIHLRYSGAEWAIPFQYCKWNEMWTRVLLVIINKRATAQYRAKFPSGKSHKGRSLAAWLIDDRDFFLCNEALKKKESVAFGGRQSGPPRASLPR